ncbi:MAG: hypothetical protein ACREK4_18075 [Candidatus Rokuibacteriota bacterium]
MDMNIYLVEWWAKERLGEMRAAVMREQIAEAVRQRPRLRETLGLALISLGQRLQGARSAVASRTAGTLAAP